MARSSDEVRRRLEELLQRCDVFLPPRSEDEQRSGQPVKFRAPLDELWRFLISSLQTVGAACGKDSPHFRELERCRELFVTDGNLPLDPCRGALKAARDDLDAGMLTDLRQLVTAEAFGDLLETAAHLIEEKHHLPAAALAGAVLESSLRTLAISKQVSWSGTPSISKLNTELYKAKVYDKVFWLSIRFGGSAARDAPAPA
jgi:hypothetical protein